MQTTTTAPRDALTDAQVRAVLGASAMSVTIDVEVLDSSNEVTDTLGADLRLDAPGSVTYDATRSVGRTLRLRVDRELSWGAVRLRPVMTLSDGTTSAKFDLGVFLPDTPTSVYTGEVGDVRTFDVECYDLLSGLLSPVARTYVVAASTNVATAVAQAVSDSGFSIPVSIAAAGDIGVLAESMTWSARDDVSWLDVINDLLNSAGWRTVWVGPTGTLRSEPFQAAVDKGTEWEYVSTAAKTIVGLGAQVTADLWQAPNKWVFFVDDPLQGEPSEGSTQYTVLNQSVGVTSIDQRGRTITAKRPVEAGSYGALVAEGDRQVENDRVVETTASVMVGPNPLHDHLDVVEFTYADAGMSGRWEVVGWVLPLDGSDMSLSLRKLVG
jgi:hypothetical protein